MYGTAALHTELRGYVGANLVATRADTGSDGCAQVRGISAEFCGHCLNRLVDDASGRTSPSGVNGGYRAANRIREEDRDAVGGLYADGDSRGVLDEGVRVDAGPWLGYARGVDLMDGLNVAWGIGKAIAEVEFNPTERREGGGSQERRHLWHGVFMT